MIRAAVIRVGGTNCELETTEAFRIAGAQAELVHLNELKRGSKRLEDYQIMAIPGGWTYGDDVAAGKMLAVQMAYEIGGDVKRFVEDGKPVIGICNGFQALVKMGLLPGTDGPMARQEATLTLNDGGKFIDKWVQLRHMDSKCIFTKGIADDVYVPIAHAEGKFVADDSVLDQLEGANQIVFTYADNPNGSMRDIAGICNPEGTILGMMPHPERFMNKWMHPHWTRKPGLPDEGDGFRIFKNAVEYAEGKC